MGIAEGYRIKKVFHVEKKDTAKEVGSGGLMVLATPVLACWVENAAYNLIQINIEDSKTSVGVKLDLNHISPTPTDMNVTIELTLKEIDRARYKFEFTARDEVQEIANGTHERVVVDRKKFMNKVIDKRNGSN